MEHNGRTIIFRGLTLTLPNITKEDAGNYSCQIFHRGNYFKSLNNASLVEIKNVSRTFQKILYIYQFLRIIHF